MSDERSQPDQPPLSIPGLPEEQIPSRRLWDRVIDRTASLPWWAIILGTVAVVVLYSMFTSVAYQRAIRFLIDDPQLSTEDKFEVVQVVGEPRTITGRYLGTTTDTTETVINLFSWRIVIPRYLKTIDDQIHTVDTPRLPNPIVLIETETGTVEIPEAQIDWMEPADPEVGSEITASYIERITITGTMTEQDDDTMTIRTVDEEQETFATSRILSRESTTLLCDRAANPDCQDREVVTIQRQGEIIEGRIIDPGRTNTYFVTPNLAQSPRVNIELPDGTRREFRRGDLDYLAIPHLVVVMNAARMAEPVQPGGEVRIGFIEGTDITAALEQLDAAEGVPTPLRYTEGEARTVLVAYPDSASALEATSAGDVSGLIFVDDGPSAEFTNEVETWLDNNPDAGLAEPVVYECVDNCQAIAKLPDDEITGAVVEETDDQITIRTVEAEYTVIDKDKIVDDRSKKPGECALNNPRGCDAGIFLTLRVTFSAYALALLIGLFVGLMRVARNPILYAISTLYVEVIRGIPLLVILLYAGFVVSPWLRDNTFLKPDDTSEAVLGLAFGYGAFVAEIFRAGIQSISRGQMEAARSLGMSYPQAMRYVVLPQAVRVVLPPLGNDFIAMLKDSALISVLALPDLLQLGRLYISRTFRAFEGYNTVAILYLLMTLFLSLLVRTIERRTRLPR